MRGEIKGRCCGTKDSESGKKENIAQIETEKKEPTLEEKAEMIQQGCIEIGMLFKKPEEFLLKLTPNELKKTLGKKELNVIYEFILEYKIFSNNLAKNNLTIEIIKKFADQKGNSMLPIRIHRLFNNLEYFSHNFNPLLSYCSQEDLKGGSQELSKKRALKIKHLKYVLESFKKREKYPDFEIKIGEEMKIKGFEKLNSPSILGQEIIKKAAEILPNKLFSTIIESIWYIEENKQPDENLGINDEFVVVSSLETAIYGNGNKKWVQIIFYKAPELKEYMKRHLDFIPFWLAHEYFHSRDPRIIEQIDLNLIEEFQIIKDWEEVRKEEEEWSEYVNKIDNHDKQLEELLKSKESWAESFSLFLHNPCYFKKRCPKIYQFCLIYFEKYFPEFVVDPEKRNREQKEYKHLIENYLKSRYE